MKLKQNPKKQHSLGFWITSFYLNYAAWKHKAQEAVQDGFTINRNIFPLHCLGLYVCKLWFAVTKVLNSNVIIIIITY